MADSIDHLHCVLSFIIASCAMLFVFAVGGTLWRGTSFVETVLCLSFTFMRTWMRSAFADLSVGSCSNSVGCMNHWSGRQSAILSGPISKVWRMTVRIMRNSFVWSF